MMKMVYVILLGTLFVAMMAGASIYIDEEDYSLEEVEKEYEILPNSYANSIADLSPGLEEGLERQGRWTINKTGAETDLNISIEDINETAFNVTIFFDDNTKKNSWKKYYDDYNKDKTEDKKRKKDEFPIELLNDVEGKLKIDKIKLDLDKNDQQSFVVTYDPSEEGYKFKLGWESVIIEGNPIGTFNYKSNGRNLVWTSNQTGYIFYVDSLGDFYYKNTSDAGSTWSGGTLIETNTMTEFSIWYDKWTGEEFGDTISIAFIEQIADDILFVSLNTTNNTLSSEGVAFAGASADSTGWNTHSISIIRSRQGSLYAGGWIDNEGENGMARSRDGGATWSSISSGFIEAVGDRVMFSPANTADEDDIIGIYFDDSLNDIKLKTYDNSSNTWSSVDINTDIDFSLDYFGYEVGFRQSDNHSILLVATDTAGATQDLLVYDITDNSTITQKTNVYDNNAYYPVNTLMINQQNDDLYVTYSNGNINADVYYVKSTDGGTTWSSAIKYDSPNDDIKWTSSGTSVGNDGGQFCPVYYNDDLIDIIINNTGCINIDAYVETPAETCGCPGAYSDWHINMSDNCVLTAACDIAPAQIFYTGYGTFTCDAIINASNSDTPINNQTIYIEDQCDWVISGGI